MLSNRKKRGIGYFTSGAVFIVVGVIVFSTTSSPVWLPGVVSLVGLVANFFGFQTVFPDTD